MCLVLRLRSSSSEECKRDSYLDLARSHLEKNKYLACHIPRHNQNLVWSLKASGSSHSSYRNEYHIFVGSLLGPGAVGSTQPQEGSQGSRTHWVGEEGLGVINAWRDTWITFQ